MPPSEETILEHLLLRPAGLTTIISPRTFTTHFPSSSQDSPEIKRLYRSLQHKRALLLDSVTKNIAQESNRGDAQRKAVIRSHRAAQEEIIHDEEILIERSLYGQTSNLADPKPHTLASILPEMEAATRTVNTEIEALEEEAAALLRDITATIGGLSDLRYGKFSNGQMKDDVVQALRGLDSVCETK